MPTWQPLTVTANTASRIFSHTEIGPMPRTPYCSDGARRQHLEQAAAAAAGPQPQPWRGGTCWIAAGSPTRKHRAAAGCPAGASKHRRVGCLGRVRPRPAAAWPPPDISIGSQATHLILSREGRREVLLPLRCSLRAHPLLPKRLHIMQAWCGRLKAGSRSAGCAPAAPDRACWRAGAAGAPAKFDVQLIGDVHLYSPR